MGVFVFCSYAPEDEKYRQQLESHLSSLARRGMISFLHSQQTSPGVNWVEAIASSLSRAEIILLLVSANFIQSDRCYSDEMKRALVRHEAGQARVIPIVIRPCDWRHSPIGQLQTLPVNTRPISQWRSPDEAWVQVVEGIQRVIEDLSYSPPSIPQSTLSPIWHVPSHHNPFFLGREAVLESLRQKLVPGKDGTALPQFISGFGGTGKTQVALEYAHRYGKYYQAVLWIQADSLEVATASCLRLATEVLELPEQQEAERQIIQVQRWLQQHHDWLLIFDNVENPQEMLAKFIPSKHHGSVLVTTRRSDVGVQSQCERLPLLSEDDAILFLLRRARCLAMEASVTEATADDFLLARDLCWLLDRLPLALDQAGAYIAENGGSFQRYIDLYQQYRPKLLDRRNADGRSDQRHGSDHSDSVLTTIWLSWEEVQQRNALAGNVLQFCSFLAPDQIPELLVQAGVLLSGYEGEINDLEMDEAMGSLHRYSLIERAGHTLSLHRLVQEVIQDVLSEGERQRWMERAILVVNAILPSGEYAT